MKCTIRPLSHWKFISKFYLEIKIPNIFLSKVSTFTLEINFRKPTSATLRSMFVNTGRLTISEISQKFRKIEHVLNGEIRFQNLFLSKVDCSH